MELDNQTTAETPDGILITRAFNESGGVDITGIQMVGDVRITEVRSILDLASATFKSQAGL